MADRVFETTNGRHGAEGAAELSAAGAGGLSADLAVLLSGDAATAARALIGATLTVDGVGGLIVETEAYDETDPASHSHGGRTERNATMFGPPGHAYVYRSYGIHWCLNVSCRPAGHGAGVLLRALEPVTGLSLMHARRKVDDPRLLCAGPGRLCQALDVSRALDGQPFGEAPFALHLAAEPAAVVVGPRIGITKAADVPWRFGLAGSRFVSRPFPRR
ncbi:DNA-3-methyladenine glycosylase [Mongoliimonas terrestris]|uniref:DNA-3-methyladenine glycosylase n=1 Tax=Mongoliimonas terrestris TaxID=1709001 RepID=UPI0009F98AF2|nr:DNA-3-methyladenine glycosylase [Mongoliimonas terrestris]